MLSEAEKETVVELLALIYARVPWGKMRTCHDPRDVFNRRVRAASRKATLGEFVSKLCNFFGLQSLPLEVDTLLSGLEGKDDEVLEYIYTHHIPVCVRAIARAKKLEANKKSTQDLFQGGES